MIPAFIGAMLFFKQNHLVGSIFPHFGSKFGLCNPAPSITFNRPLAMGDLNVHLGFAPVFLAIAPFVKELVQTILFSSFYGERFRRN